MLSQGAPVPRALPPLRVAIKDKFHACSHADGYVFLFGDKSTYVLRPDQDEWELVENICFAFPGTECEAGQTVKVQVW
jgi:hypothetical protein